MAYVEKNGKGDFEVKVDGVRVKSGYFSRMEDYANRDANRLASQINAQK